MFASLLPASMFPPSGSRHSWHAEPANNKFKLRSTSNPNLCLRPLADRCHAPINLVVGIAHEAARPTYASLYGIKLGKHGLTTLHLTAVHHLKRVSAVLSDRDTTHLQALHYLALQSSAFSCCRPVATAPGIIPNPKAEQIAGWIDSKLAR